MQEISYFIYARKSSESDDRQVQSIDDQVNRLVKMADELGLNIKRVYTEAKSAKKPHNRPIFSEMINEIEKGNANGILCWQINRLSRNPVDSGTISWLLQQGILKSIQTIDRQYRPDDNVLLFSVESGTANQFIIDLKKNVQRGIESKLQKGWAPNVAPLGYLNDRLEKTIIIDSERFNIVRKAWNLMLTDNYMPSQILDIANNQWGLRTRKWNKQGYGGNPLSLSGLYRIFHNPFYAGMISYFDKLYPGKHKAMITLEEFDRVQVLLQREHLPRPKFEQFAFTGSIRCAECGCVYTAEAKKKMIKTTGQSKIYRYYHCTRRTRRVKCTQNKIIPESVLELMIEHEFEKYEIIPEFLEWALEELNRLNDTEIKARTNIYEAQHKALTQAQKELDELTRMRYRQLIDDETYIIERNKLQETITRFKLQLRETEDRAERWLELTELTFSFACYARSHFVNGGFELKKEIFRGLAKEAKIKDKKLSITPKEWFVPIQKAYPPLVKEYRGLELEKTLANIERNDALASIRSRWLNTVKDVRNVFEELDDVAIYIPKLSSSKKTS